MSDQGIWYKLWCSALDDPQLDNLSIADFGRWAKFGAFIKKHGTNGIITLEAPCRTLCSILQLQNYDEILDTLRRFPNISVSVTGVTVATVTIQKWAYYQGDNSIERVRKFRERVTVNVTDKKRREEKRRDEKREEHKTLVPVVDKSTPWTDTLDDVRAFLLTIQAPEQFFNETYWLRIDQWLGANDSSVYYFDELKSYLAWIAAQNGHRKHKDLLRGFRNWLSTCSRWKERDAQRKAVGRRFEANP